MAEVKDLNQTLLLMDLQTSDLPFGAQLASKMDASRLQVTVNTAT